jgi:hypothetical protein
MAEASPFSLGFPAIVLTSSIEKLKPPHYIECFNKYSASNSNGKLKS